MEDVHGWGIVGHLMQTYGGAWEQGIRSSIGQKDAISYTLIFRLETHSIATIPKTSTLICGSSVSIWLLS